MKKLMELNFFDKNILSVTSYWGMYVKHNIASHTPTMYLAKADTDNNHHRKWHASGITNAYCRACNTLMIIPGAIDNLLHSKTITCPSCGHVHSISNVLIAEEATSTMPLYVKITLLELKDCLRLKFTYKAVILGENIYTDFTESNKIIEQFDFLYSAKQVIWQKEVNNETITREIGYYSDLLHPLPSTLQYLPYSVQDKKGHKISELMSYMRNYLTSKMKKLGYSKRKLFFHVATNKMFERNLLYLARKIRFWDENETNESYKLERYALRNSITLSNIDESEQKLSQYLQSGKSYLDAFLLTFSLPNTHIVRKNICYSNVHILRSAYEPGNNTLANSLIPYFLQHPNAITAICGYYKSLAKYYPQKHFTEITNCNLNILQDTVNLFNMLSTKNLTKFKAEKPSFRSLHNYLSILVTSQTANEINYHIPDHIIRRLDMQLRNSSCKVLTKYSQILQAGLDLNNCAASYKKRINDTLQLVLVTDDNGKAKVLLEIRNLSIVQAKLLNNQKVKINSEYNELILDFAKQAKLSIDTDDIGKEPLEVIKLAV